ncbi:MAG: xanthine dehydrogenase accessory factor, partial [Halieaceae bacterium]
HNHPLDFALTEAALLRNDARYIGLIGSTTKWQRFKMRFEHREYPPNFYSPVRCPVGLAAVPGKLPMEVAVSVAAEIIADYQQLFEPRPTQQGVNWRDVARSLPLMASTEATDEGNEVLER